MNVKNVAMLRMIAALSIEYSLTIVHLSIEHCPQLLAIEVPGKNKRYTRVVFHRWLHPS
jgi:hypothetical protein